MPGPRTHARRDTSQVLDIQFHGIPEREEQPDDIREVPGIEIQISEPRILVQRILLVCKDSTKTAEALIYKGFYGFVFEI